MRPEEKAVLLPDYERPPAVETLLGLEFLPLQNWKTPYFGLFWQQIRREYPEAEVHPPLLKSDGGGIKVELNQEQARLQFSGELPVRWWYFHSSGKRLVQVQSTSFIQNWRKRDKNDPYLHYDELKPSFQRLWEKFCQFLHRHKVEPPTIQACEVTYVNHIDRGQGWKTFADLGNVVKGWSSATSSEFLPAPQTISMSLVYPIGKQGHLNVLLQPGIRESDGTETIQLTLSARCRPVGSSAKDLAETFDLGREWVVRGFVDFTTEAMHSLWKPKPRSKRRFKA